MDAELFDLCKEVHDRMKGEWEEEFLLERWFSPTQRAYVSTFRTVPIYTSDYLLAKLPEWIGKYGDMQMSRGYMKGETGAFRFFYGRDGQEASIEGTGTTAVSALLKLTIALSEAGELK